MLPRISEESLRILEERARELQMNWLIPGENEEVSTRPRAGTPYPRSDTQPTPPTYQDRGVSPFYIAERKGRASAWITKTLTINSGSMSASYRRSMSSKISQKSSQLSKLTCCATQLPFRQTSSLFWRRQNWIKTRGEKLLGQYSQLEQ
jgi:hypothetical protein